VLLLQLASGATHRNQQIKKKTPPVDFDESACTATRRNQQISEKNVLAKKNGATTHRNQQVAAQRQCAPKRPL
jgi:hypothetical protein